MKNKVMTLVCLTVWTLSKGWSQQYLVNHFTSKQYHAHPLMWDMVEDKHGYLWFANNDGVVRFDGNNWMTFPTPNPVRSVVVTKNEEVFVACVEDFGMLSFAPGGATSFRSFKTQLDASGIKNTGNEKVWMKGDEVYFSSDHSIFTLSSSKDGYAIKVIEKERNLGCGYLQSRIFSNHPHQGFGWVQGNKFVPVNNGYELAGKQIVQTLSFQQADLIFTAYDGVFALSGNTLSKINQTDLSVWASKGIAGAVVLSDQYLAVATYHDGVKLFNTSYRDIASLDLPSREIFSIAVDHEHNTWIAHRKGITQVLTGLPVTVFQYPEVTGSINSIQQFGGLLYLSTTNGLFTITTSNPSVIKPVQGITAECWDLEVYRNTLYAATTNGLYAVTERTAQLKIPNEIIVQLQTGNQSGKLYAFGINGCKVINAEGHVSEVKNLTIGANSVFENADGTFWFGTNHRGLMSIPDKKIPQTPTVLSTGEVRIRILNGKPFFQSMEGLYAFNGTEFSKQEDSYFLWAGIRNTEVVIANNTWLFTDNEWKQLVDGKPVLESPAYALNGKPTAYFHDGRNDWFASEDRIYKVESPAKHSKQIKVNVSGVEYGKALITYNGIPVLSGKEGDNVPEISHDQQPITIRFGMNSFVNPVKNGYRYKIKQLTNQWSEWSNESKVVLNGLSGGKYTIVVQGRNALGAETPELEYTLYIKPAWYLSGIAFMVYISGIIALFYGLVLLYNRRLVSKNNELEKRVQERTVELKEEKQKSDALLLNILPEGVAEELKNKGYAEAKQYNNVSVLFTDFVNFTGISEKMTPTELVNEIHRNFTAFDSIIEKHGLEKIKTIGDAYMAVCGLPVEMPDHAQRVAAAALDIKQFMETSSDRFQIRMGLHSGPVVAGIVGVKKYAYDIWGDTVNTAARMEQNSEAGKINISATTYELIKNSFQCEYRGKIRAKNKGEVDMYFVVGSNSNTL